MFSVSLLIMVGVGFGGILMAASANTTMQMAVPDGLRGRVMSVYTTIFAGSTPIGGPIMGAIASAAGIAVSLAIGGARAAVGRGGRLDPRSGLDGHPPGATASTGPSRSRRRAARRRRRPRFRATRRRPNTSAAFSPPKPNEVLSTRR